MRNEVKVLIKQLKFFRKTYNYLKGPRPKILIFKV